MNREFVLRDNEVAINRPDGTVIIMNLNALRELQGDSDKDKEIADLRKELAEANARIERYKEANDSAVRAVNARVEKINDLKVEVELLRKENDGLKTKVSYEEGLKNGYKNKVDQLQKEVNDLKAKVSPNSMVRWGAGTKFTKRIPDFVYVTSEGEIFLSGLAIERAYNLPKGSVSAYFTNKQERLYPRNPDGTHKVDEARGDIFRLGVVRRFTNSLFLCNDWNCPLTEDIAEAIKCAKTYTTEI